MARVRVYRMAVRTQTLDEAVRIIGGALEDMREQAALSLLPGAHNPYATGRLAHSMEVRGPFITGTRVSGKVGSSLNYARLVHNGASVHAIFPQGAPHVYRFGSRRRPQLKFFWRKVGRTVYFPHIPGSAATVGLSHPGFRGKNYLVDAAFHAARRFNLKIEVYDL